MKQKDEPIIHFTYNMLHCVLYRWASAKENYPITELKSFPSLFWVAFSMSRSAKDLQNAIVIRFDF